MPAPIKVKKAQDCYKVSIDCFGIGQFVASEIVETITCSDDDYENFCMAAKIAYFTYFPHKRKDTFFLGGPNGDGFIFLPLSKTALKSVS